MPSEIVELLRPWICQRGDEARVGGPARTGTAVVGDARGGKEPSEFWIKGPDLHESLEHPSTLCLRDHNGL